MSKALLIAMRTANMTVTHPQAKYGYKCATCGEPMCLFPSGQRLLRENGVDGIDLCCEVCYSQRNKEEAEEFIIPNEVLQEYREAIDFTKKKQ